MTSTSEPTRTNYTIEHDPKPISAVSFTPASSSSISSPLIFAHGASGSMDSSGVANFRDGFSRKKRCVCFQGNMNLGSRVKMFKTVVAHESSRVAGGASAILGGRSMGARAAVITATDLHNDALLAKDEPAPINPALILISYPLHDSSDNLRDQILLDLPSTFHVFLAIGSRDTMCDLPRLQEVRRKMSAKTWLVVVEAANHGMDMKPAKATAEVGRLVGEVSASWVDDREEGRREGRVVWDEEGEEAQARFTGWEVEVGDANAQNGSAKTGKNEVESEKVKSKAKPRKTKPKGGNSKPSNKDEDVVDEVEEPKPAAKKSTGQAKGRRAKATDTLATNGTTKKTGTGDSGGKPTKPAKRAHDASGADDAEHISRRTRSSTKK